MCPAPQVPGDGAAVEVPPFSANAAEQAPEGGPQALRRVVTSDPDPGAGIRGEDSPIAPSDEMRIDEEV